MAGAPPFLLPVPELPPDDGSFHTCQFNKQWLPIVLTVLAQLQDPLVWQDPPSDIDGQVAQLIDLVMTDIG